MNRGKKKYEVAIQMIDKMDEMEKIFDELESGEAGGDDPRWIELYSLLNAMRSINKQIDDLSGLKGRATHWFKK